jgi:hypothetical protein
VRYRPNHRSTAQFLRSQQLYVVVRALTTEITRRARAIAPVGETGEYVEGIVAHYHGGWKDDRLVGEVEATAPHSAAVEFGNAGNDHTAQHVLRRAASGEG